MAVTLNANTSTGFIATSDTSGVLQLQTGGTAAVTVDASANVGIGNASPVLKLDVVGNIRTAQADTSDAYFRAQNSFGSTYYLQKSDRTTIYTPTTQPLTFDIAGGEKMRILSTGNILSLAGGSTTATGTGIAFPATQSASTDANTLDDYEEGTFSPTITGDTGPSSITYSSQVGRYIKIGNVVNVWIYIQVNTISGGSGASFITNLPFTCGSGVQGGIYNNWSSTGTTSLFATAGHIPVSQARAYLVYVSGGTTQQLPLSQIVSATQLIMCGSYTLQS